MSKHLETFLKRNRELAEASIAAPWWVETTGTGPKDYREVRAHVGEVNESPTVMVAMFHPFNKAESDFVSASRTSLPLALELLEYAVKELKGIAAASDDFHERSRYTDWARDTLEELEAKAKESQ